MNRELAVQTLKWLIGELEGGQAGASNVPFATAFTIPALGSTAVGTPSPLTRPANAVVGVGLGSGDIVADIRSKLLEMNEGDIDAAGAQLKMLTFFTGTDGKQVWATFEKLPGIAQRNEKWISRIHRSVVKAYGKTGRG